MSELSRERRDVIAERLLQGCTVAAVALALEFGVSADAIRRDLRALAAAGLCRRVYGGALPLVPAVTRLAERIPEAQARQRALALAARATVEPGEFVFLDASSVNLELAHLLPLDPRLQLATNSIDIAAVLIRRSAAPLLLLGGTLDPKVGGCVDATAVASVARLNIDRCFIGACAVAADAGVSVLDHAAATFKRAVLAVSRHRVALVTAETQAPHRIAAVDEFETLVVEHHSAQALLDALTRAGGSWLRAAAPGAH